MLEICIIGITKPTTSYIFIVAKSPINWRPTLEHVIALSINEAKCIAVI